MLQSLWVHSMLVMSILAPTASSQAPLPVEMSARYGSHNYAERMYLPTHSADKVIVDISFANADAARVDLVWSYQKAGASPGLETQSIETSFKPTAAARRAGTSTIFYIVGWSERSSQVVVEEWVFGQFALGSVMGPGTPSSSLMLPPISRSLLWVSDRFTMMPVWDAACNPASDTLWILPNDTPRRVHRLNLLTLALTEEYSALVPGYEQLEGLRSCYVGLHPTGGLILFFQQKRPWESLGDYDAPYTMFVIRDAGYNGTVDEQWFASYDDFYDMYPLPWNMAYGE